MDTTRDVIERSRKLPVVVDFWAARCFPRRALGPELSVRHRIQGTPTVKVFPRGELVNGFAGAYPAGVIGRLFDEQVLAGDRAKPIPEGRV